MLLLHINIGELWKQILPQKGSGFTFNVRDDKF